MRNQQSLHFEVVAAPPAQELLAQLREATPQWSLVLNRPVLEAVRRAVELDSRAKEESQATLLTHWDRALVVDVGAGRSYAILLSVGDKLEPNESDLGIWFVDLAPDQPKLWIIYKWTLNPRPQAGEETLPLRNVLSALGKRQADWLSMVSGGA